MNPPSWGFRTPLTTDSVPFMHKRQEGFTLIELMIAVAVLAILAALAYPSYQAQVIKSRRTDATGSLMDVAHVLERCYTSYGAYNNNNCSAVTSGAVSQGSRSGYYTIQAATLNATAFRLQATANAGTTQANDDVCVNLFLSNTGLREAEKSGGTDTTALCWTD